MSSWTDERIKKRGLEAFTRAKIEYALGADDPVDRIISIMHHYSNYKIQRMIKKSPQLDIFSEESKAS